MKFLLILALFQLFIIAIYKVSGWLAFHPLTDKLMNGAEDGTVKFLNSIKLNSFYGSAKIVLGIALFMGTVLFIVSSIPNISIIPNTQTFSPFKILIIYNTVITAIILGDYLNSIFNKNKNDFGYYFFRVITLVSANAWIIWPNWLTIDLSASIMAVTLLAYFRKITFPAVTLVSIAIIIYDAVAVFGTKTMQKAAQGMLELPVLLTVPSGLALDCQPIIKMGLGDIILPGLIIMLAIRQSKKLSLPSIANFAIGGYAAGFIATLLAMAFSNHPQPATIYLMPGAMAGLLFAFWKKGLLKNLLND